MPCDVVFEMDELNDDFPSAAVAMRIGSNDMVVKRSMASGYAGVDNPLFYKENNRPLFGDVRKMLDEVLTALKS